MRPVASSTAVSERMSRVATRDTAPELALRRELFGRGLRYRVDRSPLPKLRGRADIVFRSSRVAVYVDGCFWHACPEHGVTPKANMIWWREKLRANVERDRRTDALLIAAGWSVVRVWEHEDPVTAADRVFAAICARQHVASLPDR